LHQVLSEFAARFSLSLDMPTGLDAPVTGQLSGLTATEFIERLAGIYGFNWFTHAGTLYIAGNKDIVVRTLPSTQAGSGLKLRQLLTELRVLDPRFGWGELPEQGMVVVSGPPAYVRLVEATVAAIPSVPGAMQVSVFKLKHASAEDRTVTFRDRQIVTPGVATILRNLVSGNQALVVPKAGLIGNPSPGLRPSIQSDARLNAIIVQDLPERLPTYQKLIATLDIPTSLIEIEAMIIDVNANRLEELGIGWDPVGLPVGQTVGQTAGQTGQAGLSAGGLAPGGGEVNQPADHHNVSSVARPSGASANITTMVANGARHFVSRLGMLAQQGDASIHARPSILTTENIGAVIDLSETFYIQTTSDRSAPVTPITAGTTLRVTPRLQGEGDQAVVRLHVDLEDGQIQASSMAGGTPSLRRGVVSTEASLRKDESLLIGGYNAVQTLKGQDLTPRLSDLPQLGPMWSSKTSDTQRRERLVLIRTKVLDSPPASSAGTIAQIAMPPATPPALGTPTPTPAPAPAPTPAPPPPPAAAAAPGPVAMPSSLDAKTKASNRRSEVGKNSGHEARRILMAELERAEQDLAARRDKLSAGFDPTNREERNANALARAATVRAQADIEALRRELARLPGASTAQR